MSKQEIHDAKGTFFHREEGVDFIYWRLARYGSDVTDAEAVEDIKKNGYMRVETQVVDNQERHLYIKVAVLLRGDRRAEIESAINAHMGIM